MRKQSWILPLIEAKVMPVFQNYFELSHNVDTHMHRRDAHKLVKSHEFLYWYYCPEELEQWAMQDRSWTKYIWKKRYRLIREQRKRFKEHEERLN